MRKLFKLLVLFFLSSSAMASHISGGEIVWDCLGSNDYEFTLILYRDCDGITLTGPQTIDFTSTCGAASLVLPLQNPGGTEVSQLCPSQIVNSTCSGGLLPGVQAYFYTDTINLGACADWVVSWDVCCRNAAILNITNPGGQSSYIEATFNNLDYPCDNSARFTAQPIPYVCQNQVINYSFGAFDPDGDSLVYSLIGAREAGPAPLMYNGGFTPLEPIPGSTINSSTGLLNFTPTVLGNFVFVVLVEQFDNQGNVIGTILRDIQFIVIPCTNVQPSVTDGDISNFTGSAVQTGPTSIQGCPTDNFCFDFSISDPDLIDSISLVSNVQQVLPGATFTFSGSNPVVGQICWTIVAGFEGLNSIVISADDNSCPISGFQTYVYDVLVLSRTTTGGDQIICGGQGAQLSAFGGSTFTWSVLSGDPITVGQNFTCNPCDDPIAMPSVATTYVVTSDLGGACINADTVTISVVPGFSFTSTQSDVVVCLDQAVQFNITTTPPNMGGFTFNWVPAIGLSDPAIANPIGIWDVPGLFEYTVGITSADGCTQQDTTLTVEVVPSFLPEFDVVFADSICEGGSSFAEVVLDNGVSGVCGLNFQGCSPDRTLETIDVGSSLSSNTATAYPAPYGNFDDGARHQMLFRASELMALGFVGGTITELGWNIDQINGTSTYQNFEIRIGCTTQDVMTQWITGAEVVFPAQNVDIVPGWNVHEFLFGYDWDGVSNLFVEVCFDMDGLTTQTQNSSTFFSTTPFNSTLFFRSDFGGVCYDDSAPPTQSTNRPNTRFTFCDGISVAELQYDWSPAATANPSDGISTTLTPSMSPQTYTLTVGDGTGCDATTDVTVNWFPPTPISFTPSPGQGVAPLNVQFINTSGSLATGFDWTFGDINGSQSSLPDPSFIYDIPGLYFVTLTGTDVNGCIGTAIDSIEVLFEPVVLIPNVFSPNGDGENDHFEFLQIDGFRSFEMKIFNRWGNVVREVTRVGANNRIWSPGTSHSEGTYFYTFFGEGVNGDVVERTGHITLVRLDQE